MVIVNATHDTKDSGVIDTPVAPAPPQKATEPAPLWARLFMPSVGDLIFLLAFWFLTFGLWGARLLSDADTGWHIRNGDHILTTRAIPHTDSFSYTMHGAPWYAWEWLYDLVIGTIHKVGGLDGVVVFSALLIALAFTLLFRFAARLSGSVVVAAVLTLVSVGASSIHFLARPHLVTWIFVLVWFAVLDDFRRSNNWKRLAWLPVLMVLWVNLHGGFLMGLMLPTVFASASIWTAVTTSDATERATQWLAARRIGITTLAIAVATFVNPYGYHLYGHLREYLGSSFLMSNISEFLSPDFHFVQVKLFYALLMLAFVAIAISRPSPLDVLLIAFSAWAGLYAARNIPISSILLTLVSAPLLARAISALPDRSDVSPAVRKLGTSAESFSSRINALDRQLNWHVLPVALVLFAVVAAANGGRLGSRQLLDLKFDAKHLPVEAVEYLASRNIQAQTFAQDGWGGYFIYRLSPGGFLVFTDDRHDFYGEAFLKDYLQVTRLGPKWSEILERHSVNYAVVEPESALATALRASPQWAAAHEDKTAVVFERKALISFRLDK